MSVTNDLFWLAGFTEADGSICIHRYNRENGSERIATTIVLTNCDPNIINAIDAMTRKYMDIKMYVVERRPDKKNHAKNYQLTITSYADCYKFCKMVVPYMRGTKRAIGCLMMRFLESRGVKTKESKMIRQPYTTTEKNIYKQAKQLQQRGVDKKLLHTSETASKTLLIRSDDTVRARDESTRDEQK